ncbi:MAG: hypothetical protein M1837_004378 [Sclerophora amabilis]|nr:MAG: hypothetical protein M1837_004378 [Sclerophora amabilis]
MHTIPVFQIFYRTTFTVLFIVVVVLILITPGDAIRQALNKGQLYYVFIIAGVYLLTLILAILIYASRLYTNRSVLAGIPKAWIPIEKGDVTKSVRRMIAEGLTRSAVIAWDAKPKHLPTETLEEPARSHLSERSTGSNTGLGLRFGRRKRKKIRRQEDDAAADRSISATAPPWGQIAHPGWSSPSTPDLPDLPYQKVILELPHLIEAKAVSLAPPDQSLLPPTPLESQAALLPDARAVVLLQRPAAMGLRDYSARLVSLKLIDPPSLCATFLTQYEEARFSTSELSEQGFRNLMFSFASVLQAMTKLDDDLLAELQPEDNSSGNDDASLSSSELSSHDDVADEASIAPSSSHSPTSSLERTGSEGTIRTAPSFARNKRSRLGSGRSPVARASSGRRDGSRIPSSTSFRDQARPQRSQTSLGSTTSTSSVIRLAVPADETSLPYTITLPS